MNLAQESVVRHSLKVVALSMLIGCATAPRPATLPSSWDDHYLDDLALKGRASRPRLAVLPFSSAATGDFHFADVLTTTLDKTGRFDLVERARIDDIMGEQEFGRSGRVDEKTAAKIGKVLGAQAVVLGALSRATQQKYDKFAYDLIRTEVRIDARAVDAETGRIMFTGSADGASETQIVTDANGRVISGAKDLQREFTEAAKQATVVLAHKLAGQFPVAGCVVTVGGDGTMVVDIGRQRDDELSAGDRLVVIHPVERLFHPITKEPVGWRKTILGTGVVRQVEYESSTATFQPAGQGVQPVKPGDVVVLERE